MKIIQTILIFSFSLFLFSCNKENNNHFGFDTKSLKQTQWTGTLSESFKFDEQQISRTYNVGIVFYTESNGKCNVETNESGFNYSINEKLLTITNGESEMNGRWLLIQLDENKMTLEKGTGGENAYKGILTLNRTY